MGLLNLLDNGNFRRWNQGTAFSTPGDGTETADGWTAQNLSSGGAVDQESTEKLYGPYAVKITDGDATATGLLQRAIRDPESLRGKVITAIARVKKDGISALTNFRLRIQDSAGNSVSDVALSTSWQFVAVKRTIDATATSLDVELRLGTTVGEQGYVFVDGVMLLEGDWTGATDIPYLESIADAVDGFHAYADPKPDALLALDGSGEFPSSVLAAFGGAMGGFYPGDLNDATNWTGSWATAITWRMFVPSWVKFINTAWRVDPIGGQTNRVRLQIVGAGGTLNGSPVSAFSVPKTIVAVVGGPATGGGVPGAPVVSTGDDFHYQFNLQAIEDAGSGTLNMDNDGVATGGNPRRNNVWWSEVAYPGGI
jgi:hypothetical protein